MRTCPSCKISKSLTEFYKRSDRDSHQAYCKTCSANNRVELLQQMKDKAIAFLGGKCLHCGYNKFRGALCFHHPDSSLKDTSFHGILNRSWERIQSTLIAQQCVLLCANCHAEEHHRLSGAML